MGALFSSPMEGRDLGPLPSTDSTVLRGDNFPSMREIFPSLDEPEEDSDRLDPRRLSNLQWASNTFLPDEDLLEPSEEEEDTEDRGDDAFWDNLTREAPAESWTNLLSGLHDQINLSQSEESRQEILSALQRLLQNSAQQPTRTAPTTPPER